MAFRLMSCGINSRLLCCSTKQISPIGFTRFHKTENTEKNDEKENKDSKPEFRDFREFMKTPLPPPGRVKTPIGKLDEIKTGIHPYAEKEPLKPWPDNTNPHTNEVGGPKGPEPTRYGDWERKGRVSDF